MSIRCLWSIFVLAVVLVGGCSRSAGPSVGLTDGLDFSMAGDVGRVRTTGGVSVAVAGDFVGGHDVRRPSWILRRKGETMSFRLRVGRGVRTTLEFEEIHERSREVHAYLILIDGRPHYLRTSRGSGSGPLHHFVRVPPVAKDSITVTLVNQLDAPVAISRVWAFADFDRYFDKQRMGVPYYLAPTVHLKWSDFGADLTKVRQVKTSLGEHPHANAAWTTWIGYCNLGDQEIARRVEYALRLAEQAGMPVQLCFDTWWGQTPRGADGKGGRWTDEQYQQRIYNATRKQYQLSVPNRWSNTPWLTMNHPDLNAFKRQRLSAATAILAERYRVLLADGKQQLILALNLDNEPVYWASGNAALGDELLQADFNPVVLSDARRDGVALDPADGLDASERNWLWKNVLRYQEMIAAAAAGGLGRDATVVDSAGVVPAADLLRHNVYTQAMTANPATQYPTFDPAYPFWETGAPASARIGGEWNRDSLPEREAVAHHVALGRSAAVNAECENDASNMVGVRVGYALGQRFYALYNYPLDSMDVAGSQIRDLSHMLPPFVYQPAILKSRFADESWKTQVVSHSNLKTGLLGNTAITAIFPVRNMRPGQLTYRLDASGEAFDGLSLEFSGRAFVFRRADERVHIRVLAGPVDDPEKMAEVARLHDIPDLNDVHRIDLTSAARGRKTVFVRIELHPADLPPAVLSWCSIYHVRFSVPWPEEVLLALPPQDHSLGTLRKQNLLVSWRADAEQAIKKLESQGDPSSQHLAAARSALARGAYAESYRLANEGLCLTLPASFHVRNSGGLGPYPVEASTPSPIVCVLHACTSEEIRLSIQAVEPIQRPLDIRLRPTGLVAGREYILVRRSLPAEQGGGDQWIIRPSASTDLPGLRRFKSGQEITLTLRP